MLLCINYNIKLKIGELHFPFLDFDYLFDYFFIGMPEKPVK